MDYFFDIIRKGVCLVKELFMLNKNVAKFFLSLLIIGSVGAPFAYAEEDSASDEKNEPLFTFNYETDFTRYIWRGIPFSKNLTMQPSLTLSAADLQFVIWSYTPLQGETTSGTLKDVEGFGKFTEMDYYLSRNFKWGDVEIVPTLQFFNYPLGNEPNTGELALKIAYPVGNFNLFINNSADVLNYIGSYYGDLGISYQTDFTPELSIGAEVKGAWASSVFNNTYMGTDKAAFNNVIASLNLTYYATENLYLKPHFDFSTILDNELRENSEEPDLINFGAIIGADF